ncbi:MAG: caspase family protein [Sandaracinaceae bacterium]|nr:caspase family protein [Sandaracinaceae bacterium]
MNQPRRSWTRKLAVAVFASATLLAGGASAQDSLFGIPIPRIEQGPNRSLTITLGPNAPAIRIPTPAIPSAGAPPAAPVEPPPLFDVPSDPGVEPALPAGGGRYYGLFVGITHYPSASDLPFVAEDAHRVQRAFVNSGLMRQADTVVLTDAAATRGGVVGALQRLQGAAGPGDTLVFFFSGHGSQVPDRDGDELDGTDETIELTDGALSDDELTALLASGRARSFVALDSCYSGGFARDVARLTDSVGFYASREDQVSYVANEYQAGGYLSYFLAQNLTRMAGRPIPMWELSRDLRTDFDQSGATRRQELTVGVSRGVNTRTVLFDAPPSPGATMVAQR